MTSPATIEEVLRRVVEAYAPERIYLFGSRARGDHGPDSDYDLFVEVPDFAPPPAAEAALRTRCCAKRRSAVVAREGTLLHAA